MTKYPMTKETRMTKSQSVNGVPVAGGFTPPQGFFICIPTNRGRIDRLVVIRISTFGLL